MQLGVFSSGASWAAGVLLFSPALSALQFDTLFVLLAVIASVTVVSVHGSITSFALLNVPIICAALFLQSGTIGIGSFQVLHITTFYMALLLLTIYAKHIVKRNILLESANTELVAAEETGKHQLRQLNEDLEERVKRRTAELNDSNRKLKESEEKFRKAFRSIPDAVVITNLETGKFIAVNDSVLPLTGYQPKDFENRTIDDMGFWYAEEEKDRFLKGLQEHKLLRNFATRLVIKTGEIRECELSAEIEEIDGEFCVVCAIRDVSQRRRSEQLVRESTLKFSTLFEYAPNGIVIVDAAGGFIDVNQKFCEILGYRKQEIIGKHFNDFSCDREDYMPSDNATSELRLVRNSGDIIQVQLMVSSLEDQDKKYSLIHIVDITGQKEADDLIKLNEFKFRAVFDEAPISMAMLDDQGNIIEVNKASTQISGLSREELLSMNFIDVTHPDYLESSKSMHQKMMAGEIDSYRAERKLLSRTGPKWIDLSVAAIKDSEGKPQFRIAHVQDIDPYKKKEKELVEQQARYVRAEQIGKLGYWEWDEIQDCMSNCSDEYARIFGTTVEQALIDCRSHEDSLQTVHPDDRAYLRDRENQSVVTAQPLETEFRIITPDGETKYVIERSNAILNDKGEVIATTGTTQDITERKLMELNLQKRQEMVERSEKLGGVGHYEWDEVEDKMIYCSEQYANIFDMTVEELMAKSRSHEEDLSDVHPDDRQRVHQADMDAYNHGRKIDIEYRVVNSSGRIKYVHQLTEVEKNENGDVIRTFGTLQDITEHKLASEELDRSHSLYKQAAKLAGIGYWVWSEKGDDDHMVYCSEEYARIYGKTVEQALEDSSDHESDTNTIHPEDRERIHEAELAAYEEKRELDIQYRIFRTDGEIRYVREISNVKLDDEGNVISTYGTLQDITDIKTNELALYEQQRRSEVAETLGQFGHWEWDELEDKLVYCSQEYARIHDASVNECLRAASSYESELKQIHPEDRERFEHYVEEVGSSGETVEIEYRMFTATGAIKNVHEITSPVFNEDGEIVRYVGTIQDITDRVEVANKLHETQAQFKHTFSNAPIGMSLVDQQGMIIEVNDAAANVLGYTGDEMAGMNFVDLTHPAEMKESIKRLQGLMMGTLENYNVVRRFKHKNGEYMWINLHCSLVRDTDGKPGYVIAQGIDITEQRRLSEELEYQASHDSLTELINRREFEQRLNRLIEDAHENYSTHAFCYMDLDQFKIVNDTFGHAAGDELLRQLCALIQLDLKEDFTLARLGGDEFGLLMANCDMTDAMRTAEKLKTSISGFRFIWNDLVLNVGVSMGIVVIDEKSGSSNDLMKAADSACYLAKDDGRNRIRIYSESDLEIESRRSELQWATKIQDSLINDQLQLIGQPILDLNSGTGKAVFYELLLRLKDEQGNLQSAGALLSAAERYNLVTGVDKWVFEKACSTVLSDAALFHRLNLCSINLSGHSISDPVFLDFINDTVDRYGVSPGRICFEITETAAISNFLHASKFIEKLRARGFYFALDDFGTGLSSFSYLKQLPVDYVKIDGAFVKDISNSSTSMAMVKSINELVHVFGKRTIAEYVESPEILARVRSLGINFAQGYAIGKPQTFVEGPRLQAVK